MIKRCRICIKFIWPWQEVISKKHYGGKYYHKKCTDQAFKNMCGEVPKPRHERESEHEKEGVE